MAKAALDLSAVLLLGSLTALLMSFILVLQRLIVLQKQGPSLLQNIGNYLQYLPCRFAHVLNILRN